MGAGGRRRTGWLLGCVLAGAASGREPLQVAAWIPTTWDYENARASLAESAPLLSEVSPIWYWVAADGRAVARRPYWNTAEDPGPSEAEIREICRRHDVALMPLISNSSKAKGFDADLVHRILASDALRDRHVRALADLAVEREYDGIEVDYELLHAGDRDAYACFIEELGGALRARRKRLAIAIHAKTDDAGGGWGSAAHDYAALGRAADSVRIMTYDHHWATGPAGAIAPLPWFREVLAYAVSRIPREKVLMGVPAYGYNWAGARSGKSADVTAREAPALARRHGAEIGWDPASNSPFFRYRRGGTEHHVWFESAACLAEKLRAVREAGAAGIAVFRLGGEESGFWDALRTAGGTTSAAP
jgi:spore germination protein YaaH